MMSAGSGLVASALVGPGQTEPGVSICWHPRHCGRGRQLLDLGARRQVESESPHETRSVHIIVCGACVAHDVDKLVTAAIDKDWDT